MRTRLLHCTLWVVGLCVAGIVLHQICVPNNATELALRQMNEDGSREQLRVVEQLSNWITPALAVIGIVGVAVIWRRPTTPAANEDAETGGAGRAARE